MKAIQGVKMSYRLQEVLRKNKTEPIRGLRVDDGHPVALSTYIYSLIRSNRGHRRGLLTSVLNLFDDTAVSCQTPVSHTCTLKLQLNQEPKKCYICD